MAKLWRILLKDHHSDRLILRDNELKGKQDDRSNQMAQKCLLGKIQILWSIK